VIEVKSKTYTGTLENRVSGGPQNEARVKALMAKAKASGNPTIGLAWGRASHKISKTEVAVEVALPSEGVIVRFVGEAFTGETLTPVNMAKAAYGKSACFAFVPESSLADESRAEIIERARSIAVLQPTG